MRRPNLVPGVDPYITSGGLPLPEPGRFLRSPAGYVWEPRAEFDSRTEREAGRCLPLEALLPRGDRNFEFRVEAFNIFNVNNFALPVGLLPQAIPATAVSATTLQPGQAYSATTAGSFGLLTSTVGRTVGLGTNRQVQFAVRLNFVCRYLLTPGEVRCSACVRPTLVVCRR